MSDSRRRVVASSPPGIGARLGMAGAFAPAGGTTLDPVSMDPVSSRPAQRPVGCSAGSTNL